MPAKHKMAQSAEDSTREEKTPENGTLAKEKFIFDESIPIELIANTPEQRRRRHRRQQWRWWQATMSNDAMCE